MKDIKRYPFSTLEELENINLDENIEVKASVLDNYGNKLNAPSILAFTVMVVASWQRHSLWLT